MKNPIAAFALDSVGDDHKIIVELYGEDGERARFEVDSIPRIVGFVDFFGSAAEVLLHADEHGYDATVKEFPFLADQHDDDGIDWESILKEGN